MSRAHGLVALSLISLAVACDGGGACPDYYEFAFEDVDAKEAPEPYRIVASETQEAEFLLDSEARVVEVSASFEVTRVRRQTGETCDSSEPLGFVVDALAEFATADDELAFALPVHVYLSEDEPSDPEVAFISDVYPASGYPMTIPLLPESDRRLAGVRVSGEADNAGPTGARVVLEAWWVAADCENPKTCPTEEFEVLGSMPMDAFVFDNALYD